MRELYRLNSIFSICWLTIDPKYPAPTKSNNSLSMNPWAEWGSGWVLTLAKFLVALVDTQKAGSDAGTLRGCFWTSHDSREQVLEETLQMCWGSLLGFLLQSWKRWYINRTIPLTLWKQPDSQTHKTTSRSNEIISKGPKHPSNETRRGS